MCYILEISASTTTSFHPQSNGLISQFHRSLKSSLRARLSASDWFLISLCWVWELFQRRTWDSQSPRLFMISFNLTWRTSGCSRDATRDLPEEGGESNWWFHGSSATSCSSSSSFSLPAALLSAKFVFNPTLAPHYKGLYLGSENTEIEGASLFWKNIPKEDVIKKMYSKKMYRKKMYRKKVYCKNKSAVMFPSWTEYGKCQTH